MWSGQAIAQARMSKTEMGAIWNRIKQEQAGKRSGVSQEPEQSVRVKKRPEVASLQPEVTSQDYRSEVKESSMKAGFIGSPSGPGAQQGSLTQTACCSLLWGYKT